MSSHSTNNAKKRRKTEDRFAAFLIPRFADAASPHVELTAEADLILGRNDTVLGIADKNVSRSQAVVRAASDLSFVTVTAVSKQTKKRFTTHVLIFCFCFRMVSILCCVF
jgi:hypothetical protein